MAVLREESNTSRSSSLLDDDAFELGHRLREAREESGLSVKQVSETLNLTEDVIEALENGDSEKLEHKRTVYIEGYYASYARFLDVSLANTHLSSYEVFKDEEEGESAGKGGWKINQKEKRKLLDFSDALITGLVVLLALVVGGIVWWVWPSATSVDTAPTVVAGEVVDNTRTSTDVGQNNDETPFYLQTNESNQDLPAPPSDVSEQDDQVSNENSENALNGDIVVDELSNAEPVQVRGTLSLEFSADSWVEVVDATGEGLFRELGRPGQTSTLEGVTPFSLRIGDATGVTIQVNGDTVDLSHFPPNEVANLSLP